ncbi:MAG: hypothetical protein II563_07365 [Treponema sp.]|nr:hypothetical protein [Treponema sp.]MBQ2552642.1 hypothetical protein [Treponema sp.]MBQ4235384.1 hypothetical protein [Treponema sp.]MBQ5384246.1 hypothetical protein [Treponema sp.]
MMQKKNRRVLVAAIFLSLGICLILLGIFRGEALSVFMKATRICLECIGIG